MSATLRLMVLTPKEVLCTELQLQVGCAWWWAKGSQSQSWLKFMIPLTLLVQVNSTFLIFADNFIKGWGLGEHIVNLVAVQKTIRCLCPVFEREEYRGIPFSLSGEHLGGNDNNLIWSDSSCGCVSEVIFPYDYLHCVMTQWLPPASFYPSDASEVAVFFPF